MSKAKTREVDLSALNYGREAHNFLMKRKPDYQLDEINILNEYLNHVLEEGGKEKPVYKVGLMMICINQPYWQYLRPVIDGVRRLFLPGHETEIMVWNDMHNWPEAKDVNHGATIFPVDPIEWPYPTLMRYNYFLQQEEYLNKFDYLFFIDLDMRLVSVVGDEILGEGLTAARHPMYQLPQYLWYPYEPNPDSAAYIKQPGRVVEADGRKVFEPLYAAGGFQGGKTDMFIDAMKVMQEGIDNDLKRGYIARWNDESHWNKYLLDHTPSVILDSGYVYPDTMHDGYYKPKVWHKDFTPRIITITKPFSTSKEGGAAAAELMKQV